MPLYMDIHTLPGVKARDVAEAHRLDLLHQREYGCNCMTYWIDERRDSVFCLISAPDRAAVERLHRSSHGLEPNKIIEVDSTLVESFLGRIFDPETAEVTGDGVKVFHDPSYRVILLIRTADPVLLSHSLGKEEANDRFSEYQRITREIFTEFDGREAEHRGSEVIASFTSVAQALEAAAAIGLRLQDARFAPLDLRMALDGGEPVGESSRMFGDTIRFAGLLSRVVGVNQIGISSSLKELATKNLFKFPSSLFVSLSLQDEDLLRQLFTELESRWSDPDFDLDEYCRSTAMSRSKLYRKSIQLTGASPNQLLKDHRLERALELLRDQRNSVAQVSFETGFTSPSYFTKCFKEKFQLLPMAYAKLI